MKLPFGQPLRLRFTKQTDPEETAAFFAALAGFAKRRACRTCDYGDSPKCGHEQRAERVCTAPVGVLDCAAVPCLGSCSNPFAGGAR